MPGRGREKEDGEREGEEEKGILSSLLLASCVCELPSSIERRSIKLPSSSLFFFSLFFSFLNRFCVLSATVSSSIRIYCNLFVCLVFVCLFHFFASHSLSFGFFS